MTRDEILSVITNSFSKILEHNNFELKEETTALDVDGWESVTHLLIITEIEKSLNIKFKLMDLMTMQNIGDLIKTILEELKKE